MIGGSPVPSDAEGVVNFRPAVSGLANPTSARIVNGRYDAPDVPIGQVDVTFNIRQPTGQMVDPGDGGRPEPGYRDLVPAAKKSGMSIDVTGDKADMNFEL
jgi:hypothetical protein